MFDNIQISLTGVNKNVCRLWFDFDTEGEVYITSTNDEDNTQHDYDLEKSDYLFLREQLDKHFNIGD